MTLFTGSGSLPKHIYCNVQRSAIRRDVTDTTLLEPVVWFGLNSMHGKVWGCHILTEDGAVIRNVRPNALFFGDRAEEFFPLPINKTQVWDCYGSQFSLHEYDYLRGLECAVSIDAPSGWESDSGHYLFTAIPMNDAYTAEPAQSKEFMFIALDSGHLTIQPTDKVAFFDRSFNDKNRMPQNIKRQDVRLSCE